MQVNGDLIDVVEHLVVLLKDRKKMGPEESRMLLERLDRVRAANSVEKMMSIFDAAMVECDCENCRRNRGEMP